MPNQGPPTELAANSGINWVTTFFMVAFHIGAIAALFFFTWNALFIAIGLWWISGSLGIGMGYHRLLTHRSYRTPKWVEYFLTFCSTLTLEGGPIFWSLRTVFIISSRTKQAIRTPRVMGNGGRIWAGISPEDPYITTQPRWPTTCYLAHDRFHVWITKYHYLPILVLAALLFTLGGLPLLLWGVFLRTVAGLHATWLVNSATHIWGSRRFATRDDSTNDWLVALLTFGEGWYNNHHAHPTSARHGLRWYEIDMNWYGIWMLKVFGLAKQIKSAHLSASQSQLNPMSAQHSQTAAGD